MADVFGLGKEKAEVILEGFLLSVHSPSKSRVTVTVDCSKVDWAEYKDVIFKLQDVMAGIDDKYKKRKLRGRGLKARHRRITSSKRLRKIDFAPFPSSFLSIIGDIRRRLYDRVNLDCLCLQEETHGYYKRKLYLLPFETAPSFMAFIKQLNLEVEELKQMLNKFKGSRDYKKIKRILSRHGLDAEALDWVTNIPNVRVDLTPLRLDPKIVKDLIEEKYRKVFDELEERKKRGLEYIEEERLRGLEALKHELERKRKEIVIDAIEKLHGEINEILKTIVAEKKLKGAEEKLLRLKEMAENVGLTALSTQVITPLSEAIENPEKAEELFGENLVEGVSGRIRGLIKGL